MMRRFRRHVWLASAVRLWYLAASTLLGSLLPSTRAGAYCEEFSVDCRSPESDDNCHAWRQDCWPNDECPTSMPGIPVFWDHKDHCHDGEWCGAICYWTNQRRHLSTNWFAMPGGGYCWIGGENCYKDFCCGDPCTP